MHKSIRGKVLLAGACLLASISAWGQQDHNAKMPLPASVDIGVTYAAERAYIAPGNCDCFWFNGGGVDAAVTFWRGFGVAAAFTGDHASNVMPGVGISKVAYIAGPRYTYTPSHLGSRLRGQLFGEALFGGAHAFDSTFPSTAGLKTSADSFAMQIGGGVHVFVSRRFTVRALEADYVRTALPNGVSNVQNDMRLGFGVSYHVGALSHSR